MRKIQSKTKEQKIRTRNQLIVGGILVFLMIFSVIGYSFQGSFTGQAIDDEKIVYNGIEFVKQYRDFWGANIGGINLIFRYHPGEVEEFSKEFSGGVRNIESYIDKPLYIYSENSDAEYEIRNNFVNFAERMQNACLEGLECIYENVPIKDCSENFIIIVEGDGVEEQKNCVFIRGDEEDLVKITDGFLFKIFGIN